MNDQSQFDIARFAVAAIVIVGALFALPHLLPLVTSAVLGVVPLVVILWFIVVVLRGIVSNLFQ